MVLVSLWNQTDISKRFLASNKLPSKDTGTSHSNAAKYYQGPQTTTPMQEETNNMM